jgi:hypothetical protein
MNGLRGWIMFAWIAVPTVMCGGYSLIQLISRGNVLTPAQVNFFRAGHAHAGVLTLMSLLYYTFLDQTSLLWTKHPSRRLLSTRRPRRSQLASSLNREISSFACSRNGLPSAPP